LIAEISWSRPLPSTANACAVVPSLTLLKTYVPGFVSEIVFGLSLYSVSWPPEGAELSVEAAVESSVVGAAGDAAAARNGGHDDDDGTKQGESVRPHVA
jgi:hypothetical protein